MSLPSARSLTATMQPGSYDVPASVVSDPFCAPSAAPPRPLFGDGSPAPPSSRPRFDPLSPPPLPLPLPLPPLPGGASRGKRASTHLRYEKSSSLPSARTSTKHRVSGNLGLQPALMDAMPAPIFSAAFAWCDSRSLMKEHSSSASSTSFWSSGRACATTAARPTNSFPPKVTVFFISAGRRRSFSPSSDTSTTSDPAIAAATGACSAPGSSAFMRLKVMMTEMGTHFSEVLAISVRMNLSLVRFASEK
mmetsp:Transcript_11076/g.33239  ORF Transcript_11076/g.33239 Transcript_11076/m.33239 type:complete len:249 (-) Transcript_11076:117-863(-)